MENHENQEAGKLLYEIVGYLYEIVRTNIENSKFSENDAMSAAILMQRHSRAEDKQVQEWIRRCRKENHKLFKESSSVLLKKINKSLVEALSQSVTVVKATNVTINKNYPG